MLIESTNEDYILKYWIYSPISGLLDMYFGASIITTRVIYKHVKTELTAIYLKAVIYLGIANGNMIQRFIITKGNFYT